MKIRKAFLVTFSIFFLIIFYFGIHEYEGQLFYFIFCSLSSFFCLIYLTDRDSFYFENFLSSFLFLGIWFNFTIKISFFNSTFPEGVGQFDYSPSSYDEVMLVSSITYLSLIFSSYLEEFF